MTSRRLALLVSVAIITGAQAHPLLKRADTTNDDSGSNNAKTYIAAGVVVGILAIAFVFITVRRSTIRNTATAARAGAGLPATTTTTTSTANQTAANTTANATTTNPPRRTRRPRRTPSQISTKSLPAYNEEPGDEELVLVQRASEPEEYSRSSIDVGDSSTHDFDTEDDSAPEGTPPHMDHRGHRPGLSIDSVATGSAEGGSQNSHSGLLTSDGNPNVPPVAAGEEAPSYMEALETETDLHTHSREGSATAADPTPGGTVRSVGSRIMPLPLRNFFSGNRSRPTSQVDPSVPMLSLQPSNDSNSSSSVTRPRADTAGTVPDAGSVPSLLLSRSRSPSNGNSRLGAPLQNGNASSSSLALHSRNRSASSLATSANATDPFSSTHRLNSPSTTSINSALISSPLSHTATRTVFRFPKSGPTPEQLKFLSSRESLGKFGVPFGHEAEVANAPPPSFRYAQGESRSELSLNGELGPSTSRGHASSRSNPSSLSNVLSATGTIKRWSKGASADLSGEGTPTRAKPVTASWWQQLTRPAGAHSPPKTSVELPALGGADEAGPSGSALSTSPTNNPETEAEAHVEATPTSTTPPALPPSDDFTLLSNDSTNPDQEPPKPEPTPSSSLTLSVTPTVTVSRATSISSSHSYATAADTAQESSNSPPRPEAENDAFDNITRELETPTTPRLTPSSALPPSIPPSTPLTAASA